MASCQNEIFLMANTDRIPLYLHNQQKTAVALQAAPTVNEVASLTQRGRSLAWRLPGLETCYGNSQRNNLHKFKSSNRQVSPQLGLLNWGMLSGVRKAAG